MCYVLLYPIPSHPYPSKVASHLILPHLVSPSPSSSLLKANQIKAYLPTYHPFKYQVQERPRNSQISQGKARQERGLVFQKTGPDPDRKPRARWIDDKSSLTLSLSSSYSVFQERNQKKRGVRMYHILLILFLAFYIYILTRIKKRNMIYNIFYRR